MPFAKSSKKMPFKNLLYLGAFITFILSLSTAFSGALRLLELFSHFKLQFFVFSLISILIFLYFRRLMMCMLMLFSLILNAFYLLPWYLTVDSNTADFSKLPVIKIFHSNVLRSNQQYSKLLNLIQVESPDLILLQEYTYLWDENINAVISKQYPYSITHPQYDSFGIALFSKQPIKNAATEYWGPSNLASLSVEIEVTLEPLLEKSNRLDINIIATHPLPPINSDSFHSRNIQLQEITGVVKAIKQPVIVLGDLNSSMWSPYYTPLETEAKLVNARKGFGLLPTWPAKLAYFGIPIDHCLVSKHFTVVNIKTGPDIGSDHLPLIAELALVN